MSQLKVYVGNLPYSVTQEDLTDLFSPYGPITEIKLIKDRDTGRSKGFAFVSFENQTSAQSALKLDGTDFQNRRLNVNLARENTKPPRRGSYGGGGSEAGRGKRSW